MLKLIDKLEIDQSLEISVHNIQMLQFDWKKKVSKCCNLSEKVWIGLKGWNIRTKLGIDQNVELKSA